MFLNSMFSQMTSGLKGEGPFGDTPGTGVWRSMLTDEYAKSFAKAGGVGISDDVFRTLIMQQASAADPSSKEIDMNRIPGPASARSRPRSPRQRTRASSPKT